jgi:hypothetical protein
MTDKERIGALEKRVSLLERTVRLNGEVVVVREGVVLDLILPEADVDRLRFNWQEVQACFEKGEDDWYYSESILFLSARNIKNDNRRDILKEYLNTIEIGEACRGV